MGVLRFVEPHTPVDMSIELTTSVTVLRLFRDALASLGADWEQILGLCDIAPEELDDCEARIAQHRIERIWTVACEVTRDPCIGLHAGEHVHPRAVNLFGYLLLSSETVGEGVERVARYQHALTGVPWISIQSEESSLWLRVGMQHGDREILAIHAEYVAALVLRMMSWVSETQIEPAEARFAHAPRGEPAEYERILRCPVKFEADQSELVMNSRMRHKPSMHANAEVARLHEHFATELLARQVREGVAHSVRRALAHQLESGPPDLASVARELAMSARSLQRRLAEEETSFREVLEILRRDLARRHLAHTSIPISEIAYLAGFSEASAFTRAVRRWFGRTPAQVRREALE